MMLEKLAPRVGLEPTAYRLTAECSTIELPWNAIMPPETAILNMPKHGQLNSHFTESKYNIFQIFISLRVDNYHQESHLVRDLILNMSVLFRNCSKLPSLSFFVYIYENNLLIYCFSSIIFRLRLDYRFFSLFSFQGSMPNLTVRQWWAWEDSNFRPHAYQACALTC